jgi:hypothetical protein
LLAFSLIRGKMERGMKLVYSQNKNTDSVTLHRFEVLGDFSENDLDVLKSSLFHFIETIHRSGTNAPVMILDFSESKIRIHERVFQDVISEIRNRAIAEGLVISTPQTDIESIHAESQALESALNSRVSILENRLQLMESVKSSIIAMEKENELLREKVKKAESKKGARGIFEKLWSET